MKAKHVSDAEWIAASAVRRRRCGACRDVAAPEISRVIALVSEAKAFRVTMRQIYDRVCELCPGFADRVGFDTVRKHLSDHEPEYHRFKGARK